MPDGQGCSPLKVRQTKFAAKILSQINQILGSAGGEEIRRNGYRPAPAEQSLDDFARFVAQDQQHWLAVFKKAGIAPAP